jgi:hypothetical protein
MANVPVGSYLTIARSFRRQGFSTRLVSVWLAVSFTTVITYEVIKIWQALGKSALKAFFGIGQSGTRNRRS